MRDVGKLEIIQTNAIATFACIKQNAVVQISTTKTTMSDEKIERILASYKPVEDKPGYVWVSHDSIAELKVVRETYEEYFGKVGEIDDKGISTEQ